MLRIGIHCSAVLISAPLLSLVLATTACHAQAQPANSASLLAPSQSDQAAIEAMRNVVAQSGGDGWRSFRSAKETFSITAAGQTNPRTAYFLDDWSQDSTRYRRAASGAGARPGDHNGDSQFKLKIHGSDVSVPEFDQSRTLVARFPAAAAEVMLRRQEYVLKISATQHCKGGEVCVDVYRHQMGSSTNPEQQWKISSTTGLPETIRYQTTTVGAPHGVIWREIFYLKYANEGGLTIPVSLVTSLMGRRQSWTFSSLEQNPGFDTAKFDQESR